MKKTLERFFVAISVIIVILVVGFAAFEFIYSLFGLDFWVGLPKLEEIDVPLVVCLLVGLPFCAWPFTWLYKFHATCNHRFF